MEQFGEDGRLTITMPVVLFQNVFHRLGRSGVHFDPSPTISATARSLRSSYTHSQNPSFSTLGHPKHYAGRDAQD